LAGKMEEHRSDCLLPGREINSGDSWGERKKNKSLRKGRRGAFDQETGLVRLSSPGKKKGQAPSLNIEQKKKPRKKTESSRKRGRGGRKKLSPCKREKFPKKNQGEKKRRIPSRGKKGRGGRDCLCRDQ